MAAGENYTLPQERSPRAGSQRQVGWPVGGASGRVVIPGVDAGDGGTLAVAFAVHLDDGRVVHEAVDRGDSHGGIREDVVPCRKWLVGGNGERVAFVAVGDELEQGAGLDLVLADVGQIVEHDEIEIVELVEIGRGSCRERVCQYV